MNESKHMVKCFCCDNQFQFGPHAYLGRRVLGYDFMVCHGCDNGNWDGWGPHLEPKILKYLSDKGIESPARNKLGWLPREWPQDITDT